MGFDALLQAAAEGLVYGGLYALLGLGFYLTFGVLRRVDLAYGTTIMASVYVAAMVTTRLGLRWYALIPLALVLGLLVMGLVERIAFRWVSADARFSMVATVGIWMAVEEVVLQHGGGASQPIANPFGLTVLSLGPVELRWDHLAAFAFSLLLAGTIYALLYRTQAGRAIRLVAHDPQLAGLLGVDQARTGMAACALASGVGVAAGYIFAMAQSAMDVHFAMWATTKGLIILVLGGVSSIFGIMAAGLGLGILERIGTEISGPGWRDLFGYGLMLALLLILASRRDWVVRASLR